jgi:hypothetical protein
MLVRLIPTTALPWFFLSNFFTTVRIINSEQFEAAEEFYFKKKSC